jgi:trans-aconitate 2-methyltransferase
MLGFCREKTVNRWDPERYLKLEYERTMPSYDLAAHIDLTDPRRIVDIGCGPGNSTKVLMSRWPTAEMTGLDNSEDMIAKARATYPGVTWILADAAKWTTESKYDIVFSNATLQWLPNHKALVKQLFDQVEDNGVLAVQVPTNNESPLHKSLIAISERPEWKDRMVGCQGQIVYHDEAFYYSILSTLTARLELWTTTYLHIIENHQSLIEWYSSTGMKAFLARLKTDEEKGRLRNQVLEMCKSQYPVQKDGKIIFPFKRVFFIAWKT